MTWPSSDVYNGNLVNSNASPAAARADLLDLMSKFNQLRNHLPTFMQGFVGQPTEMAARQTLSIGGDAFRAVNPPALADPGVFINYATVVGAGFNNTTGEYTVPTAGRYMINIVPYWVAASFVQTMTFGIQVNGADPAGGALHVNISCPTTTASGQLLQGSRVACLNLSAGDKVRVGVVSKTSGMTAPGYMAEFSMGRLT